MEGLWIPQGSWLAPQDWERGRQPLLSLVIIILLALLILGSRDGVVVIALASHLRGLGSSGSWLLVLYSAPRGFSPGCLVFPSPQKNKYFQIPIWTDAGLPWKPLWGEWSFRGKYQQLLLFWPWRHTWVEFVVSTLLQEVFPQLLQISLSPKA